MSTDLDMARSRSHAQEVADFAAALPARLLAAALSVAVVVIHVMDQGGFPGSKDPRYVGIGYYLLEAAGVVAAGMLLSRKHFRKGWFLGLGVALGPIVGYVLSRGPGMPLYTDDRGNWTEAIGLLSLAVEGILLVMVLLASANGRRRSLTPS